MSCDGNYIVGKSKEWLKTEVKSTDTIEDVLRILGYSDVRTVTTTAKNEVSVRGDYKCKEGVRGVFIDYFNEENGERVEISSSDKNRAEGIESEIKRVLPRVGCELRIMNA